MGCFIDSIQLNKAKGYLKQPFDMSLAVFYSAALVGYKED
jgi:hypothetical protein